MKKLHIILIVLIAAAVGVILSTLTDASTYVSFEEAFNMPGKEFHVVGKLDENAEMVYNPEVDAQLFTFNMVDNKGEVKKVFLHKAKPTDFEKSEQIVLIGKTQNGEFHARDVLMKCPSKYNGEKAGQFVTEDEMKKIMSEQ